MFLVPVNYKFVNKEEAQNIVRFYIRNRLGNVLKSLHNFNFICPTCGLGFFKEKEGRTHFDLHFKRKNTIQTRKVTTLTK